MKIKTSTRISLIFAIFTFFIVLILLILLNLFSFLGWYNEEKSEVITKINTEYDEILKDYSDENTQKKELFEDIEELGGFIYDSKKSILYDKLFLEVYKKDDKFFIIHEKNTKFGSIFLPYDITTEYNNQLRLEKIGIILLILTTFISFLVSRFLFIKLALRDILYISNQLKQIDLNNIKQIDLNLNKNDEIKLVLDSINNFLSVIDNNTKSLKEFNSHVSHELKTPLMVISSELEYLSLTGKNNDSYLKIEKQIDILNELLETFLFISKLENFKGDIKKDNILIKNIIESQLINLVSIYESKNIKVKIIGNNLIKLQTNKQLFEVLIKNLLDNSFKYNKIGGEIIIDYNDKFLLIKDNGIGIKKENISKIFNTFFRVGDYSKGYGIGLNIVSKIIDILGFKIEVKSKFNKGSEFKIVF